MNVCISGLYFFTSHVFTTCCQTGPKGPSIQSCRNSYSSRSHVWTHLSEFFNMDNNQTGIQKWTVPIDATYRISAYGAAGGNGHASVFQGGKGAKLEGTFILEQGLVINIVCGQMGTHGIYSEPGGGGGGTFVYTGEIGGQGLLIAAGGGGGGGEENTNNGYDGQSGQYAFNSDGYSNNETNSNSGNGYGGIGGKYTVAGAGWKSVGGEMNGTATGYPGDHWEGGFGISNIAAGGFGGGGSACSSNGGGGGGGYTGGSGVFNSTLATRGGGGAGSYNSGENQINTAGYNDGDGYVVITKV